MYVFRRLLAPYRPERPGQPKRLPWSASEKEPVMVRAFFSKAALLVVLMLLLAAPVAQAAEPGAGRSPVLSLQDVFARAWDFLANIWANNGCGIDPNGHCQGTVVETNNGCGLDPDGRCQSASAESENGCLIEPNGRCRQGQTVTAGADNGCGIDPSGGCGH